MEGSIQVATLNIGGMTCATCANAIEKLCRSLNGVNAANVSILMNQCIIEFDSNKITIDKMIDEIEDIGFDANMSSVENKKSLKTDDNNQTKKLNMNKKNIIIWAANINADDDKKLSQNYFYDITKDLVGINKIVYNNNSLSIYFNKTQILPLTITHLLQTKTNNRGITFSDLDVSLSFAYQNDKQNQNQSQEPLLSELKKITFALTNINQDLFDFKSIETKLDKRLIKSTNINRNNGKAGELLINIEYYDNLNIHCSTSRLIYKYLLQDPNISELNLSIIDQMSVERDEFRSSQIAIVTKIQKQFYMACLFAVPAFIIAMILPLIPHIKHNYLMYNPIPNNNSVNIMGILLFLLATPVQFWIGRTFYVSAWGAAKHKTTNMSTLIVLGTTVAWIYSFIALTYDFIVTDDSLHGASHFFETSSTVITIVLLGKWLQAKAKFKTCDAISLLMNMQSPSGLIVEINEFGEIKGAIDDEEEISTELIIVGDILKIHRGGRIPLDGTIIYGETSVDERMITGESIPRFATIGDKVISSSINCGTNMILIRVDKSKSNSVISKMINLMKVSQTNKPKQQEFADTVSSYFVPIVVFISVMTFIIWYSLCMTASLPASWHDAKQDCTFFAILFSMAVMVIACPCALGLATPTAVMVGMGVATKYGALIKGGNILEIAHNLDIIVFDKTGTLTYGKPKVVDHVIFDNNNNDNIDNNQEEKEEKEEKYNKNIPAEAEILYYIGCSELNSEHPLAKAIVSFTKQRLHSIDNNNKYELETPSSFNAIPGKGIRSEINGNIIHIGNYKWFNELNESAINKIKLPTNMTMEHIKNILNKKNKKGNISLLVSINYKLISYVCLFDSPRTESKDIIYELQNKYKLKCVMLTGDNHNTAVAVANSIGINQNNVISQVLPQDKHKVIKQLQLGKLLNGSIPVVEKTTKASVSPQTTAKGESTSLSMQERQREETKILIIDSDDSINSTEYKYKVAMVGDGINDAAALSQADLGIAIGNGTDIAIEAADVILMNDNLWNIGMIIDLSTKIIHRIYLNFFWAFCFNCLGIPIAAGVLYPSFGLRLPPELAAIAMACSSLCVIISSILLKTYKSPYNKSNENILKGNNINVMKSKQKLKQKNINKKGCGCGLICNCKKNKYIQMKSMLSTQTNVDDLDSENNDGECQCANCGCHSIESEMSTDMR